MDKKDWIAYDYEYVPELSPEGKAVPHLLWVEAVRNRVWFPRVGYFLPTEDEWYCEVEGVHYAKDQVTYYMRIEAP